MIHPASNPFTRSLITLVLLLTFSAAPALAASGGLESTFDSGGAGGKLTTDFFGKDDTVYTSVLQPDGRLVAAGRAQNGPLYAYTLALYNLTANTDVTLFGVQFLGELISLGICRVRIF